jgi:hypothetical protein
VTVRVSLVTDPSAPDWPNEDFAAITPGTAVLIDGAGSPGGRETGCVHGVAWYARTLGGLLAAGATGSRGPLADVLAEGISQVSQMHASTCDLAHPGTPSATVIIARYNSGELEYLVLADSLLLLQPRHGGPVVITDTRLEDIAAELRPDYYQLRPGTPEHQAARLAYITELDKRRNQPGGYWSAAADPAAAGEAITGSTHASGLAAVALLSDGVGRLADRYRIATWPQIAATLAEHGPGEVIRQLRNAEASDPQGQRWPRSKIRDDATALYWTLD